MAEDSDETVVAKEESAAGSVEAVAVDATAAEQPGEAKPASVDEPAPTLGQVFSLPEKEGDPSDDRWQAFQDKVNSEVKKIKWTATMPDLAPKVCELLNIKIPDVLITAWKKVKDIQAIMEKSKKTPDETVYLELAQHTIKSEHKPSIDVKIKGATVKKIEMVIQLGFDLKGFLLKIQNGAIKEVQTGQCEAKGTIKYGGLTVAERKLQPLKLPFSIPIPAELFTQVPEVEAEKPAELERIEL
jgi:hypothetical protein